MRRIDSLMLEHLHARGGTWATARELALEVGHPWRVVARTMIRLAGDTRVEQSEREWVSSKQRTRRCYIYRHIVTDHEVFPAWLLPRRV